MKVRAVQHCVSHFHTPFASQSYAEEAGNTVRQTTLIWITELFNVHSNYKPNKSQHCQTMQSPFVVKVHLNVKIWNNIMWFVDESIIPNFWKAQSIWCLHFFRVNEKRSLSANVKNPKLWFSKNSQVTTKTIHWFWRKMSRDLFRRVLMTQLGAKSQRVSFPPYELDTFSLINWTHSPHKLDTFTT